MLTNVVPRLTAAERAREPRMLHLVAWFDGYGQAHGARPVDMPRRLTTDEAREWRDGWNASKREQACHTRHGFDIGCEAARTCPHADHTEAVPHARHA